MTDVIPTHSKITLSIIIVNYNMGRELPRTLRTLSRPYQSSIEDLNYEIIIVDNRSSSSLDIDELFSITPTVTLLSFIKASNSPVDAINFGLSVARGQYMCAWIDGARMATPGLLEKAIKMLALGPRIVVGTLSLHLGLEPQNQSVKWGYDQTVEDKLLESINWRSNGYALFEISSFDPSSKYGYFSCPAETNCLFMSREMWNEAKLYDPAFKSRGGGLANLDIWFRLCSDSRNTIAIILGEATFHQIHGGVTTNAQHDQWFAMNSEYSSIRGHGFTQPSNEILLYGAFNEFSRNFLKQSGLSLETRTTSFQKLTCYVRRILTKRGRSGVYSSIHRRMRRFYA